MPDQPTINRQPTELGEPSPSLKQMAEEASVALMTTYRRDTSMRFNMGGRSGGSFLMLNADPVRTVGVSMTQASDEKITLHALISVDFLKDATLADHGIGGSRYLYRPVDTIAEAIAILKDLSNLETL